MMFSRTQKLFWLVFLGASLACSYAFSLVYINRPVLKDIKKVAIFPFENVSGKPRAGEIITQIFFTELKKSRLFKIEEMGDIMDFIIRQRIKDKCKIDRTKLTMLRNQFKVDAVFMGVVRKYEKKGEVPVVYLTIRLVETKTGRIVWQGSMEKTGEDYIKILNIGRIKSLNRLVQCVVRDFINTY